jgi:hypothetical protein
MMEMKEEDVKMKKNFVNNIQLALKMFQLRMTKKNLNKIFTPKKSSKKLFISSEELRRGFLSKKM